MGELRFCFLCLRFVDLFGSVFVIFLKFSYCSVPVFFNKSNLLINLIYYLSNLFLTGFFMHIVYFLLLFYGILFPLSKVTMFPQRICTIALCVCFLLDFRSSQYRYLPALQRSRTPYLSYLLAQLVPKQWWLIHCYILAI